MEEVSTEAVYGGSDSSSHDSAMITGVDNDILFDGSVMNMSPAIPRPNGPDALKGLLESDDRDLKLWLEHTRFFDIEYRHKVLDGLRKLKAIDEQRSEILLEIQNTAGVMITPSSIPLQRQDSTGSTAPASILTPAMSPAEASAITPHHYCTDRATKEEPKRTGAPAADDVGPTDGLVGIRGRHMMVDGRNGASPVSHAYHESCRCDGGQGIGADATRLPLMNGNTDIRYFLVKSFNTMNVEMSQRDGLWITKAKNGPAFTEAFNQCKTVILFFSINKSKAFQGYARMVTAPRADIAKAEWMGNIDWETSNPFRIEWLNTRRIEFWKFGDLRNPLNDGSPVFVGRDGQEYPEDCGRKVMEAMDRGVEKRSDGPSWGLPHGWENPDQARADSREGSRRGDKPNWRRMKTSPTEGILDNGLDNGDGADSQDNMTLIDY